MNTAEKKQKGKKMINEDITELLEQKVLKLRIANESRYWGIGHIAVIMDKSESQVKRRIVNAPNFPSPIKKEQADGTIASPLYVADEVREWLESDRETRLSA